jgi:hypothetical protein|nr:hypothetical protein [Bacillaceae bacterium]
MMDSAFDFLVFSLSGFIEIPDGGYSLSWMMGNFPTEKGRRWEGMEWEKFEIGIWIYLQRFRQGNMFTGNLLISMPAQHDAHRQICPFGAMFSSQKNILYKSVKINNKAINTLSVKEDRI